uniref:Uncharacterized protein n=1 Tax=Coccidioides posadasii RMSCC 3488 TaxID=454284 RepID=A0A0J6FGH4_COCPO|nr:hypothetical protein CPAG_08523 [Coccidioides posadasii RMSCC 3488]
MGRSHRHGEPVTSLVSISRESKKARIDARNVAFDVLSCAPAISRVKAEGTAPSRDKSGMVRTSSTVRFSSAPIPETKVATEEGTGPSIMFAATDLGRPGPRSSSSIYKRPSSPDHPTPESSARADRASGYPLQASVPLSFNDLPRRAQHLIVNELMKSHSKKTAVIMTTLPSPVEGTCRDPGASQQYLSDLEQQHDCDDESLI